MDDVNVFCGEAHPELAKEICKHLELPLSPAAFRRFSNDCQYIQLRANCRERDVFIIQPLAPPVQENLMQLLLMLDAARGASARRRTAVIPYLGYARSDKKDAPRISIAGRLVADLLATAGADRVLTITLHSEQVHGFFSVPVDHLNALQILAEYYRKQDLTNTVVVSPDLGNAKAASHFAKMLGIPVAAGRKQRLSDDSVIIDTIVGEVADRNALIMDDEIANGGSVMELIAVLRKMNVRNFRVACTHGLFTREALPRLVAAEDVVEVVTTNTIPLPPEKRDAKLKVLSIGGLVAEAIRRIHFGQSVSGLFSEGT
jgi:ribose-phosphate pyrophosphokinase